MKRTFLAAAALLLAGAALAQPPRETLPTIVAIAFEGNEHTVERTMAREISVHVGDPAEPAALERSRQAIQDLGLFRSVSVDLQPAAGGIKVVFRVIEKYYLIPAPRADANSDKQYAYGVQLRWYNVLGLNHTMKLTYKQANRQEAGRGTVTEYDASYNAPFVFDSPYGLDLSYAHAGEPVEADPLTGTPAYDERRQNARFVVSRAFPGDLPPSQGWRIGAGLAWQESHNIGLGALPDAGQATGLVLGVGYSNVHFNIYSEEGQHGAIEGQVAGRGWGSDYDYSLLAGSYDRSWYLGETPHQSLAVFARGGVFHGGPENTTGPTHAFELGGAEDLRGYPHNLLAGNAYYYAGIEYLRPLYWDWLRGVVFLEGGKTFQEDSDFTLADPTTDVGLGVRVRFTWFVRLELNAGIAWPLEEGGGGSRFFATGRR